MLLEVIDDIHGGLTFFLADSVLGFVLNCLQTLLEV
jgi:acyl-coenzyme A thioesterase PaaI-like protein